MVIYRIIYINKNLNGPPNCVPWVRIGAHLIVQGLNNPFFVYEFASKDLDSKHNRNVLMSLLSNCSVSFALNTKIRLSRNVKSPDDIVVWWLTLMTGCDDGSSPSYFRNKRNVRDQLCVRRFTHILVGSFRHFNGEYKNAVVITAVVDTSAVKTSMSCYT